MRKSAMMQWVGLALVMLTVYAFQSVAADFGSIPDSSIAKAVNQLQGFPDEPTYQRESSQEHKDAAMYLITKTEAWRDRESYTVMLRHPSSFIRIMALSQIYQDAQSRNWQIPQDDPFRPMLLDILEADPVLDVRAEAALTLGQFGDKELCIPLWYALSMPLATNELTIANKRDMSIETFRSDVVHALRYLECPETARNRTAITR